MYLQQRWQLAAWMRMRSHALTHSRSITDVLSLRPRKTIMHCIAREGPRHDARWGHLRGLRVKSGGWASVILVVLVVGEPELALEPTEQRNDSNAHRGQHAREQPARGERGQREGDERVAAPLAN